MKGTCLQQLSHNGSVPHEKQGNCNKWRANTMAIPKKKECALHKVIHIRDSDPDGPPFSVEVECEPHESSWICLCASVEDCMTVINNFPLVCGGLASREGARLMDKDCILANIPKRP